MKVSKRLTNRGKKVISSNTAPIIIGIAIIIVVLLIGIIFSSCFGEQFNPNDADRQVRIRWEEVNLRASYSTSGEIITTLRRGSIATLTGNSYNYLTGELPTDSWVEIKLEDGTTGWVVTTSIKTV